MPVRTNAVRVLDGLGIRYELREYDVDPNDLSAETVAAKVGLAAEQVFKTLAVVGTATEFCSRWYPGTANSTSRRWRK